MARSKLISLVLPEAAKQGLFISDQIQDEYTPVFNKMFNRFLQSNVIQFNFNIDSLDMYYVYSSR